MTVTSPPERGERDRFTIPTNMRVPQASVIDRLFVDEAAGEGVGLGRPVLVGVPGQEAGGPGGRRRGPQGGRPGDRRCAAGRAGSPAAAGTEGEGVVREVNYKRSKDRTAGNIRP